ncbi:MAG: hypothetical protein WBY88_16630 [Desulfosarcina sp.]
MDRHRLTVSPNRRRSRSPGPPGATSRNPDKKREPPVGQVDIVALVRSLQRSAGVRDCFRSDGGACDIVDCDWRSHCQGPPNDSNTRETRFK